MNPTKDYTEHYYQSLDGLRLYYRSYGSGDNVLVCLPGLTRNSKDFETLARRHAKRWRVICPDLRGRGQSEWDPQPSRYRPETYVDDIWNLLDTLAVQRFAVVGTSQGGWMAMIMAAQQAERLRGVVLNDVGPVIPAAAFARIMKYAGRMPPAKDWQHASAQVREAYELALPDMTEEFWLGFLKLSMYENAEGLVVAEMDPAIGEALRKTLRAMRMIRRLRRLGLMKKTAAVIENGYWDHFRAMTMPCLLLRGAISDVLPSELSEQMKASKPDLETVTVANRGHTPLLDEAEACSAIDTFLGKLIKLP